MKRILIIVAVLLILLSGCANNTVQPPTGTETVNDSTTDTFPQVEKETTSSQAVSQESSVNIDSLEESTQDTDESKTVQTEASSPKQTVPDTKVEEKKSPSIKDETTSSQAETSSTSTKDQPKPTEAKPREQEKPKETEAILTRALYLNMPAVIMVWTGSKKEDNGLIIQLNLRPA